MHRTDLRRRRLLLAGAIAPWTAVLGGCAGAEFASGGPAAEAPALRVGDRWRYRAQDGFRMPLTWDETREVVAAGPSGITVRVTQQGPNVDVVRTEEWASPGLVRSGALMAFETKRFEPPLERYRFPMVPGQSWNQWVRDPDNGNQITPQFNNYVRVGGWEKVTTPAGAFDAVRLRVLRKLDDEEFFRYATECNYLLWYAPAVGSTVREEREAEYMEKGDLMNAVRHRSQHAVLELVEFRKG